MSELTMKKWLVLIGVLVLTLGITGCSNTNEEEDLPTNESKQENKELNTTERENENENEAEDNKDENDVQNIIDEEEDLTIIELVNKQYSLDETYTPDDLVTIDVPTVLENPEVNQLREVAADALKSMFGDAEEDGIYLHARSGYRSYQTQVQLFESYKERNGEEAANRYSAKPGQSEHQTGLVMDITSESVDFQLTESFGETDEGKWVKNHAHEYGFIIRYPEGAEEITGYIYEPWHLRYLGEKMATNVYESGLTYEEYLEEEDIIHEVIPQ